MSHDKHVCASHIAHHSCTTAAPTCALLHHSGPHLCPAAPQRPPPVPCYTTAAPTCALLVRGWSLFDFRSRYTSSTSMQQMTTAPPTAIATTPMRMTFSWLLFDGLGTGGGGGGGEGEGRGGGGEERGGGGRGDVPVDIYVWCASFDRR